MIDKTSETTRAATRERWGYLCDATVAPGASLSFAAARAGILGRVGTFRRFSGR